MLMKLVKGISTTVMLVIQQLMYEVQRSQLTVVSSSLDCKENDFSTSACKLNLFISLDSKDNEFPCEGSNQAKDEKSGKLCQVPIYLMTKRGPIIGSLSVLAVKKNFFFLLFVLKGLLTLDFILNLTDKFGHLMHYQYSLLDKSL